ncbi:syntaxin 6 [Trypanosoma conorhini]|uniref:Syntaxin 6 n=1 Tax=Trypanosoma conorhini TaxID=83891 RepID=A0A422P2W7_9TRYP|nr:syntaxin 6 [Trypanosoma conorhini]RNF12070.1 syntaxin 6 [Trypanosoma conorhini]
MSSSATSQRRGEDPWPRMEKEVEAMMNGLLVQMQRYREVAHPTVIAGDEMFDFITAAAEEVEEMRAALDTAIEHPELFAITTEELQSRAERTRAWERDMKKALDLRAKIVAERQRRAAAQRAEFSPAEVGMRENNEFLQQEHEAQQRYVQADDVTIDRLAGGVRRVRDTAVNIKDELNTQEYVLDDIDSGMTRAQMRLDGVMRKVGKLLDSASDSKKMICIVVLVVILLLLIMFVVK